MSIFSKVFDWGPRLWEIEIFNSDCFDATPAETKRVGSVLWSVCLVWGGSRPPNLSAYLVVPIWPYRGRSLPPLRRHRSLGTVGGVGTWGGLLHIGFYPTFQAKLFLPVLCPEDNKLQTQTPNCKLRSFQYP